jgi:hypothetical protein
MLKAIAVAAAMIPAAALAETQAPICTDRPGKANGTCTVPAGAWQLESSFVDWLRLEEGGSQTEVLLIGSTFVKLGLSGRSDLQLGITPYVRVSADGNRASGFGDMIVRYKHRLTGEGSGVQVAAIPFVKLPTADGDIGNGKVEGGLSVPVGFALGPLSVTVNPEFDWLADGDGHGRHPAMIQVIALSAPVAPKLTVMGDLWASWNYDPDGTARQASADAALAYLVNDELQLDAGANFGLTRETPDIQLYGGVSIRF